MLNHKHSILCVEGYPDNCALLSYLLERESYQVVTATSFGDAAARIAGEAFDCYLLDYWLISGDGIELCRQVRSNDIHVPIIVASSDPRAEVRERALRAGAQQFLAKPYDPFLLCQLIQQLLRTSSLRAAAAKKAGLAAVKDEIEMRLNEGKAQLNLAKQTAIKVEQYLLRARAYQAFTAQGGTSAQFTQVWPETLNEALVETSGQVILT